jgi:lipopolysaccharide export system permease protein
VTRGIFFRHVLREIAVSTLVVGLVLLVVLATYQLAFVLKRAASGEVPGVMVPELALLALRTSLAVIVPFALHENILQRAIRAGGAKVQRDALPQ